MRLKAIITAILLTLILAPASVQAAAIFQDKRGGGEFALFPFWKQIITDMAQAEPPPMAITPASTGKRGPQCASERRCMPIAWTNLLDSLRKKTRREQMTAINQFANA